MAKRSIVLIFVCLFCFKMFSLPTLDLDMFSADPTVTIADDGQSATFREDQNLAQVLLWNDPNSGADEVIVPGIGVRLQFDYEFSEGEEGEDDEFGAFVLDAMGNNAGSEFEFFTSESGSGIVTFDLSPLAEETFIGLQFQLSSNFGDTGTTSTVTISNVQVGTHILSVRTLPIEDVDIIGIPEGTTNYQCLVVANQEISLTAPSTLNSEDYPFTFERWTVDTIPQDLGELTLTFTVQSDVEVVANYLATISLILESDWNFISTPLAPDQGSNEAIFSSFTAWTWEDNRFKIARILEPGLGYWVYNDIPSAQTIEIKGSVPSDMVRSIDGGWQLFGILENHEIPIVINEKIVGPLWGWNEDSQRLFVVSQQTLLAPQQGYWLYLREGTELTLGDPPQ